MFLRRSHISYFFLWVHLGVFPPPPSPYQKAGYASRRVARGAMGAVTPPKTKKCRKRGRGSEREGERGGGGGTKILATRLYASDNNSHCVFRSIWAPFHRGLRLTVRWISIVAQWQIVYNLQLIAIATLSETGP